MFKLSFVLVLAVVLVVVQARSLRDDLKEMIEILDQERRGLEKRSCVALGGTGCEGNNGRCCRDGNPYTGTMRKCVNKGSFSSPKYTCV